MNSVRNSIGAIRPCSRARALLWWLPLAWILTLNGMRAVGHELNPGAEAHAQQRSAPVGVGSDQNPSDSLEEAARLQKQADAHIDARQFREATDKTQRALELRR